MFFFLHWHSHNRRRNAHLVFFFSRQNQREPRWRQRKVVRKGKRERERKRLKWRHLAGRNPVISANKFSLGLWLAKRMAGPERVVPIQHQQLHIHPKGNSSICIVPRNGWLYVYSTSRCTIHVARPRLGGPKRDGGEGIIRSATIKSRTLRKLAGIERERERGAGRARSKEEGDGRGRLVRATLRPTFLAPASPIFSPGLRYIHVYILVSPFYSLTSRRKEREGSSWPNLSETSCCYSWRIPSATSSPRFLP